MKEKSIQVLRVLFFISATLVAASCYSQTMWDQSPFVVHNKLTSELKDLSSSFKAKVIYSSKKERMGWLLLDGYKVTSLKLVGSEVSIESKTSEGTSFYLVKLSDYSTTESGYLLFGFIFNDRYNLYANGKLLERKLDDISGGVGIVLDKQFNVVKSLYYTPEYSHYEIGFAIKKYLEIHDKYPFFTWEEVALAAVTSPEEFEYGPILTKEEESSLELVEQIREGGDVWYVFQTSSSTIYVGPVQYDTTHKKLEGWPLGEMVSLHNDNQLVLKRTGPGDFQKVDSLGNVVVFDVTIEGEFYRIKNIVSVQKPNPWLKVSQY
jgi:hypothetical protein